MIDAPASEVLDEPSDDAAGPQPVVTRERFALPWLSARIVNVVELEPKGRTVSSLARGWQKPQHVILAALRELAAESYVDLDARENRAWAAHREIRRQLQMVAAEEVFDLGDRECEPCEGYGYLLGNEARAVCECVWPKLQAQGVVVYGGQLYWPADRRLV